jgi:hypothetical protein
VDLYDSVSARLTDDDAIGQLEYSYGVQSFSLIIRRGHKVKWRPAIHDALLCHHSSRRAITRHPAKPSQHSGISSQPYQEETTANPASTQGKPAL